MWIYTILTYNFIHFPAELLICETAFVIQKQKRGLFGIRIILSLCLYFALAFGWDRLINEVLGDTQASVAIVFSAFYSDPDDTLTIYNGMLCPAYGTVCCAMILVMEYDVLRENRMKREQELIEEMLQMANGQQKSIKDAIDIINIKCHDCGSILKKRIATYIEG